MQFNSVAYFVFLFFVVPVYFAIAKRYSAQRLVILIASAFFYAFWSSVFLVHLVVVLVLNYWASILIIGTPPGSKRRWILVAAIAVNLLNLFTLKYVGLAVDSTNALAATLGWGELLPRVQVFLPLAISFYTFSVTSYLVDIYRESEARANSLLDFLFYAMFFPHLIAGPILRKHEFFPQCGLKKFTLENFHYGAARILIGLFQKAVIADNLAIIVEYGYRHHEAASLGELYVTLVAYSFQIFFDFAGYSAIAIGSARLFGYVFPENFNNPYRAENASDFWRRWHMTLSRWIRDYIYIPLGGSRSSAWRTNANLMITMGLAGLWHGAAWTFVVWGLYHGLGLAVHRLYEQNPLRKRLLTVMPEPLYRGLCILVTFHFVMFGWVLFRSPSFEVATAIFRRFLTISEYATLFQVDPAYLWKSYGFTAMALYALFLLAERTQARDYWRRSALGRVVVGGIAVYLVLLLSPIRSDPFIYFQF